MIPRDELTIERLNTIYDKAKNGLSQHFAELRSNILLDTGYHHIRSQRFLDGRTKSDKNKKVKITKNYIPVITSHIQNNIINANPGTGFFPRHEADASHQKAAELTNSVWQTVREKVSEEQHRRELIKDYVVCGEAWLKTSWDANGGTFRGYYTEEPEYSEQPIIDDDDDRIPEEPNIKLDFTGAPIWERIYPFDVITDINARSWDTCRYVIVRKLIPTKELKKIYEFDEEKLEYIHESGDVDTYQIFDGLSGHYYEAKEHVVVREMYIKPCVEYKSGYYIYFTSDGILEQGDLPTDPEGNPLTFPIHYVGYDQSNTSVRSFGIIKRIKANQLEINRASSAAVMESLVLGHSTILTQAGSKLSSAGMGNGMKRLVYQGVKPDIVRGTNGDQYMNYIAMQVKEMFELAQVPYRESEKTPLTNDVMGLLFMSLQDKKRFSLYAEKFERFLLNATKCTMEYCRAMMSSDELIPIVGKNEMVNISEFQNTKPLDTIIKMQPRTDDFVSVLGRSIQISQILQYAGKTLTSQDIGKLARNLPFLNSEQIIEDSLIDYDLATNTILALDRGEQTFIQDEEDHNYMIKRLTNRMKKPDFVALPDHVKKMYNDRVELHTKFKISQQEEAAKATSGFIPSGGGEVSVDMYDRNKEGKSRRLRLPTESIYWLVQKLAQQGTFTEDVQDLPATTRATIGRAVS